MSRTQRTNVYRATPMTYSETVDYICATGSDVTSIVEGHIGSGKSALIDAVAKKFPTHRKVYMDMTVMHEGDFRVPAVNHERKTTEFYYNESLGLHDDVPVILMLDEMGKASKPVKDAALPLLVERRAGNRYLHKDSILLGTTNLGAENVGDTFQAHHRNRMSFVKMGKPTAKEWVDNFAAPNGLSPELIMWVQEKEEVFHSYEQYESPDQNIYIFHPKEQRTAFVTHRSAAQASKIIQRRHMISPGALENALVGTIGAPATLDLQAWIAFGDSLPKRSEIVANPDSAKMPDQIAGKLMLTHQALNWVDEDTIEPWMDYMARMPKEMQAMFCTTVIKKDSKQFVFDCDKFTSFAVGNQYLFM